MKPLRDFLIWHPLHVTALVDPAETRAPFVRRNRAKRLGLSWGDSSCPNAPWPSRSLGASAVLPGPAPGRCRGGATPRPSHNSMLPAARRTARPQPLSGYMYPARSTRLCARQSARRPAARCRPFGLWEGSGATSGAWWRLEVVQCANPRRPPSRQHSTAAQPARSPLGRAKRGAPPLRCS